MPPSEASAPGSMGKNRPRSRRCALSCLRVTPGSTTQSRSSGCTASTAFIRLVSTDTPPVGRVDVALERRARPERNHRDAPVGAQADDLGDLLGRLRIGPRRREASFAAQVSVLAVLLAHRRRHREALGEARRQRGGGRSSTHASTSGRGPDGRRGTRLGAFMAISAISAISRMNGEGDIRVNTNLSETGRAEHPHRPRRMPSSYPA